MGGRGANTFPDPILVRRPVFPTFGHKRVFLRFDCIKRSGDSKPVVQPVFDRKSGRDIDEVLVENSFL
ncbi:hypothetical protein Lal_00012062 [Lupinus albus]|nr:hypothetical protein Lal_00012062 [Lupinus albus]